MILSNSVKNAMLQGFADLLSTGDINLKFYQGVDLIVQMPMPSPVINSVSGGVITFNNPEKSLVIKTGTPDVAKIVRDGVVEAQLVVGTELVLTESTLYSGGYLNLTALSINI